MRRMVHLSRYAAGGWRHTRERRQGSVGFWTGSVEGFACERASHIPTAEFRVSTQAWGYICRGGVCLRGKVGNVDPGGKTLLVF